MCCDVYACLAFGRYLLKAGVGLGWAMFPGVPLGPFSGGSVWVEPPVVLPAEAPLDRFRLKVVPGPAP